MKAPQQARIRATCSLAVKLSSDGEPPEAGRGADHADEQPGVPEPTAVEDGGQQGRGRHRERGGDHDPSRDHPRVVAELDQVLAHDRQHRGEVQQQEQPDHHRQDVDPAPEQPLQVFVRAESRAQPDDQHDRQGDAEDDHRGEGVRRPAAPLAVPAEGEEHADDPRDERRDGKPVHRHVSRLRRPVGSEVPQHGHEPGQSRAARSPSRSSARRASR